MNASGVLNKTALIFGQMNEPPGARMRVAETGLTMAEYFREESHKDVLLFIDNIFRFVQAGSEVSALMGRMPPPLVTSPRWPTSWVPCRSVSLPPVMVHHLGSGRLCACRRPDRPRPGHHLCPPGCHYRSVP